MKLGFEETQLPYTSGSQSARVWTERWVRSCVYCPNCGCPTINPFPNNSPVADFFCVSCKEEYELKSQKSIFGNKVLDVSFRTKCERLVADNNPNLLCFPSLQKFYGKSTTPTYIPVHKPKGANLKTPRTKKPRKPKKARKMLP